MSQRGIRLSPVSILGLALLFVGLVLAVSACGEDSATPTPAPTAPAVPTASATAAPSPAPSPTPTPRLLPNSPLVPTPTTAPAPTPSPTPAPSPTPSPTPVPSPFPLTITGSNGVEVTFDQPPKRIVAIDSAAVEILFAIGQGSRIVGTHDYVQYPAETASIEKVGSAFAVNLEKIAALDPDLIFIFFETPVSDLETLGVPVLFLEPPANLAEVSAQIRTWGQIVDQVTEADALAEDFEASINEVERKLAGIDTGPRVFHDEAPGLWTTGSGSLADEVYSLLKAENIFGDMEGYAQVSAEEIVARDPEVIISVHDDGPDSFRSNPVFSGVSAVETGRLAVVDGDLLSVPGPRLVQGIEQVASALYPDLFQ